MEARGARDPHGGLRGHALRAGRRRDPDWSQSHHRHHAARRGISREHAIILFDDDQARYEIEDLESTNGTKVNGKRVRNAPLAPGDEIQIGHTVFEFVIDA